MNKLKKIISGIASRKERKRLSKSNNTNTTSPSIHTNNTTSFVSDVQIVQNFRLVWLDSSIDEVNNDDCINTITQLRQVVNTMKNFTDVDECIDFITDIEDENILVITSGEFGQTTVPIIHDMTQINCIYIFCNHKARHEQWAQEWSKVRGVFTDIIPICQALKQAAQECDHNSISISFVKSGDGTSTVNLDTLDQSFMYTQILKEILLTIDFQQVHIDEFLMYCREQFTGNITELTNIDKMEQEYPQHQPIWWYTYNCFLYSMLNRALRTMEVDLIIKMGFFVRDLHNHIVTLHTEQYDGQNHSDSFTVYRGQGLSQTDFDQLKNTQGGLLSFNNFLSTSEKHDVSLEFAQRTVTTSTLVGVLFVMKIDPSISATSFASVENVSCYGGEKEILFSMHSIFRIGQVKRIDNNDRLWQVDLILTADNDPQLQALAERMREETYPNLKGWCRLANLLVKLALFDKAQQMFNIMLIDQTIEQHEEAHIYYMLGMIKRHQGEYTEAIRFYKKAIKIDQEILPANHPDLATSYSNIGLVYNNMGECSKALSYYEKVLEINEKSLPANHPNLAASYNNIGGVYNNMNEYSKALSNYDVAHEIYKKALPENHPNLATSYNNIGSVYNKMAKYKIALLYFEKALEIKKKTLPANHPDLASSYGHIGAVSYKMKEYSKSVLYYEQALKIAECSLPPNHPSIELYKRNLIVAKDL